MPRHQLHHGDALTVLPTLPAEHYHLVLADPPYNSGGRTAAYRTKAPVSGKYVDSAAVSHLEPFVGDSRDQRGYAAWLGFLLAAALRTTVPGGHCLVFTDWRQLPATTDAVQAGGWIWQGLITWHKPVSRPRAGGFRADAEFLVWGTNGTYDKRKVYLPGHYSVSTPAAIHRRHLTEKPVAGLLAELVKVVPPGGRVLDPFAGSGSAGVAALAAGLDYTGIEASRHYAAVARDRLGALKTSRGTSPTR